MKPQRPANWVHFWDALGALGGHLWDVVKYMVMCDVFILSSEFYQRASMRFKYCILMVVFKLSFMSVMYEIS